MSNEILVAIFGFVGTLVGTIGGILTSNRLTGYRITQLEIKVDKHNNLIERMFEVEKRISIIEDEMKGVKR